MLRSILFLVLLLLTACIDPVELKNNEYRKHLVVEGSFTNLAELNYVRLSYSQPNFSPYNQYEEKATVMVVSSDGEMYPFAYTKAGYYYPVNRAEAKGKEGKTYTLNISAGGKNYRSQPVTLKKAIPLDTVQFKIEEKTFAYKGDRTKKTYPGYTVQVDYSDPADEQNYLRWSFNTVYEVQTQPWDYVDVLLGPLPKDCCVQCFLDEDFQEVRVIDDRLTNGKKVRNQQVMFLPFERYFGVKNKLTVYQYSITEQAYNFFKILEKQKESTGTVFDPLPAEVRGNVFNMADAEESVLGFFDVSAVSKKNLTIMLEDIDYPVPLFLFPDDCQELRGATRQRPQGW